MISIIKKLLCTTAIFFLASSAFASNSVNLNLHKNYLLTTPYNVKSYSVASPSVLSLTPFFTIFNEKNVILIQPKKVGKTSVIINTDKKSVAFNMIVDSKDNSEEIEIRSIDEFDIILIDTPPDAEKIEIDPPPLHKEVK